MLIRVLFRREEGRGWRRGGGEEGRRRTFHFYKATLQSTI